MGRHAVSLTVKRTADLAGAAVALLLFSPLIAGIALTILLIEGRPVFHCQPRIGKFGRELILLKFRTMTAKRDEVGELLPDERRITRLGAWLRRMSLDELPEFVNVLRGDMSLVGPRPLRVEYRDLYSAEQWRRHEVRPGMAGPVIAGGRNLLPWEEKLRLDVWYVDNWSLCLDLRIFLRTFIRVVTRHGVSAEGHATMPRFEGTTSVLEENEERDSPG